MQLPFPFLDIFFPGQSVRLTGWQWDCCPVPTAVALSLYCKYSCEIKDPVKRTQEGGIFAEEFAPLVRTEIACQNQCVWAFFVVPSINDVKEHPCIRFIEYASSNLVYDQAGWLDQSVDRRLFAAIFSGIKELYMPAYESKLHGILEQPCR